MRTIDELGITTPTNWWADLDDGRIYDGDGYPVININGIIEHRADARLIAAAPKLYRCLREAVIESCHECIETAKCCPHKSDNGCFVTRWRDALAAASGENEEGEAK